MKVRVVLACGLFAAMSGGCSSPGSGGGPDGSAPTATGPGGATLAGTWTVMTTATQNPVTTTVTIGQDSLDITSPDFTFTATRTANVLTFTDDDPPGGSNTGVLTATQMASPFNAGILPFNLGGTWFLQGGPKGVRPTVACTLGVNPPMNIVGACQYLPTSGAQPPPTAAQAQWFGFTTMRMSAGASMLGDFGGHWVNTWTWDNLGGGSFPCTIDFTGNTITTCSGGAMNGQVSGSPLAGISATWDGANMVSGSAHGWAEFSAMR